MSRRAFAPTPEHRRLVEMLVGLGIPEPEICGLIAGPHHGGAPIAPKTLRKYFARELATGHTRANANVGKFIYASILGLNAPDLKPITDDGARARLAIFWAKTRMGWKERSILEVEGARPDDGEADRSWLAERLARLAAGASAGGTPSEPDAGTMH